MGLGSLNLTNGEGGVIQQALEMMVRERAGGNGAAKLTNPINVSVGTKWGDRKICKDFGIEVP